MITSKSDDGSERRAEEMSGLTDETPETTEQTKINISPLLFAMMVLAKKKWRIT